MLAPLSPFLAIASQVNVRRRGTAGCRRELRKKLEKLGSWRGKCAKFHIWGWAGGMAGKIWKLGHAEKITGTGKCRWRIGLVLW